MPASSKLRPASGVGHDVLEAPWPQQNMAGDRARVSSASAAPTRSISSGFQVEAMETPVGKAVAGPSGRPVPTSVARTPCGPSVMASERDAQALHRRGVPGIPAGQQGDLFLQPELRQQALDALLDIRDRV